MRKKSNEYTAKDISELDELHEKIGILEQWKKSSRRAEILSRTEPEEVVVPDDRLQSLIEALCHRLEREPTVNEVMRFIYGSDEDRADILGGE